MHQIIKICITWNHQIEVGICTTTMTVYLSGLEFTYMKFQFIFQARPLLSHAMENQEFGGLTDPRLDKNFIESEMFRMIEAAAACVRHSAAKRPRMGQVI